MSNTSIKNIIYFNGYMDLIVKVYIFEEYENNWEISFLNIFDGFTTF